MATNDNLGEWMASELVEEAIGERHLWAAVVCAEVALGTVVASGDMLESYELQVGGRVGGIGDAESLLRDAGLEDEAELSSTDPAFPVIDRGIHVTAAGRRGSLRAPNGITDPALRRADRAVK